MKKEHPVKRTQFFNRDVAILCQNENGPCPLLAICNALILRGDIVVRNDCTSIGQEFLIQLVANKILERHSQTKDPNEQKNIDDAVSMLPQLAHGLDVNVKFNSPVGFEYTQELIPFDMLGTRLFHGWCLDPQDKETANVVNDFSYNQLVEKLIAVDSPVKKPRQRHKWDNNLSFSQKSESIRTTASKVAAEVIESIKTHYVNQQESGKASVNNTSIHMELTEDSQKTDTLDYQSLSPSSPKEECNVASDSCPENKSSKISTDTNRSDMDESCDIDRKIEADTNSTPKRIQNTNTFSSQTSLDRSAQPYQEAEIIRRFLNETSSQLTFYGLASVTEQMNEREIAVFFRNNHFSTIFKLESRLYLLVSDDGYREQPNVVWELLDEIAGDTIYTDGKFHPAQPQFSNEPSEQHTADYLLAMSLQSAETAAVEDQQNEPVASTTGPSSSQQTTHPQMTSHNQPLNTQVQTAPKSSTHASTATKSSSSSTRHYRSNRERYAAQANTLRDAHMERQRRRQTDQVRSTVVENPPGIYRSKSGHMLTDEEIALYLHQQERRQVSRGQVPRGQGAHSTFGHRHHDSSRKKKHDCTIM